MKITNDKYPLANYEIRHKAMNEPEFIDKVMEKVRGSNYKEDADFEQGYLEFIAEVASARHIKTRFIAEPVTKYLFAHSKPLMTKMWPFLNDMENATGLLLYRGWQFFYRKFDQGDDMVVFYLIINYDKGEVGAILKKRGAMESRGNYMTSEDSRVAFVLTTLFLPFLEFAECETKVINATTNKHAKLNKDKYFTDVNTDIELVDSNWFTTIIRTEGFGVSGHFRLQAYGSGLQQRKLIWIKDFEKHGYTRRSHIEIKKEEEL